MPAQVLVISSRTEDAVFGMQLARAHGFGYKAEGSPTDLRAFLVDHPQTLILWDADDSLHALTVAKILKDMINPLKVFAITDKPLNNYKFLFQYPVFCTHLIRRYEDPATLIYSKLVSTVFIPFPFGLERYFSTGETQKILLKETGHKKKAVDAINNFLEKQQVPKRLATQVGQACDELIMNAIFDAPIDAQGDRYRRKDERDKQFVLSARETVEVEIGFNSKYLGICISDQFGSLSKESVLKFLRTDYKKERYMPRKDDLGAGLGLNNIVQAGLSLCFVCKPDFRTDVMIFFPKSENYKDFRAGFRFVSIISE
jgi:hypothetical protein